MRRVLAVAALLEQDTSISADQTRALGLDRAADIATFLPIWEAEEAEHARVLRYLTSAAPSSRPPPRPAVTVIRRRGQALVPAQLLGRWEPVGVAFCTLGAAAEYVATVLYTELATITDDPELEALLRAIVRQEGRHLAFFTAAARRRARSMSWLEQRAVRSLVRSVWTPVGMASLGARRWWATIGPILDQPGVRDRIRRMDRVVDRIDHLDGLDLMGSFLASYPGGAHRSSDHLVARQPRSWR